MTTSLQSYGLPLDKIATMLSLKIPTDTIALALGCHPDKIAQLIDSSEDLQALLVAATAKQVQHEINKDTSLRSIERDLLTQIKLLVPESESLSEVTAALQRVEAVKRSQEAAGIQQAEVGSTLNLTLSHIGETQIQLTLTQNNQIESINGRTMASMPYKATMDMIQSKKFPERNDHIAKALDIQGIEDLEHESTKAPPRATTEANEPEEA